MQLHIWEERLHRDRQSHEQPHSLPHDCAPAGAQWTPNVEPYDHNKPIFPVVYSEEDKKVRIRIFRTHRSLLADASLTEPCAIVFRALHSPTWV